MKNWEYKKLGDVCKIQNGYAFDSKFFTTENKGMPLIRIRDIKRGYSETFYTADFPEEFIVHEGDFLIGMDGEFNIGEWKSEDALLNQRVCRIKCDETKVLNRYIYYLIPAELKKIEDVTTYTTVKHLSSKQISEMNLPLPPLEEQKRIVKILDEKFAQLETVKANAKANLQNAKDLFQSQLTKAFSNNSWEKKRLGDISTITSSKRIFKDEYVPEGIPFYRTKEIKELSHGEPISLELFISKEKYEQIKNQFGVPQIGDVLISAVGTIGEILVIDNEDPFYFKDGNIIWMKDIKDVDSDFLKYQLTSFVEQLKEMTRGAAYSALTIEKLKECSIPLPPLPEQKCIVEQLDSLSQKVRSLEEIYTKQLANCDELKQAFLAKAFNGEL